jgi:hypothetical protein
VLSIPDGLEESIRESQVHDVLHRLLPQEVVDAVEALLRHQSGQPAVQLARGDEVGPERFLHHQARIAEKPFVGEFLGGVEEARRRYREVEDRQPRPPQSRLDVVEDLLALAANVRQARKEGVEDPPVEPLALRRLDCGSRVLLHLVVSKRTSPDSDHGTLEDALLGQVVKRGQRLRTREIAGDAEDDESVGDVRHEPRRSRAAARSMLVPSSRSSTAARSLAEWTTVVMSSGSM